MSLIKKTFADMVKTRANENIVDIVDTRVKLKAAGKTFTACCPLHEEDTPSFHVDPNKGSFHCYGCGQGGSALDFVMKYERVTFPVAVTTLAAELNLGKVEFEQDETIKLDHAANARAVTLSTANTAAATFFSNELPKSPEAIQYLFSRGFTGTDVSNFSVGFASGNGQNLKNSLSKQFSADVLEGAGLIKKFKDKAGHHDTFWQRIIFPIHTEFGKLVGFGGRRIDGKKELKYLNTAQTDLFTKSLVLYGLHQAIQHPSTTVERGVFNVTEGYMDVIAAHRAGYSNTVGTMGTAISEHQVKKLFTRSDKIRFVYDGDKAGIEAILRSLKVAAPQMTTLKTCTAVILPAGEDIDSLLQQPNGKATLDSLFKNELPMSEFILQHLISKNATTTEGHAKVVKEVNDIIALLSDEALKLVLRDTLYKALDLTPVHAPQYEPPLKIALTDLPAEVQESVQQVSPQTLKVVGMLITEPAWANLVMSSESLMRYLPPLDAQLLDLVKRRAEAALANPEHPAHTLMKYLSQLAPETTHDQIIAVSEFNQNIGHFHSLAESKEQAGKKIDHDIQSPNIQDEEEIIQEYERYATQSSSSSMSP